MRARDLPRRPGEHGPDDVGKKGGGIERPTVDQPTDAPGDRPGTSEGDTRNPPA